MEKFRWADLVQGIWKRSGTTSSISTVRPLWVNVKSDAGDLRQMVTVEKSPYRKLSRVEMLYGNVCSQQLSRCFSTGGQLLSSAASPARAWRR